MLRSVGETPFTDEYWVLNTRRLFIRPPDFIKDGTSYLKFGCGSENILDKWLTDYFTKPRKL